MFGLRKAFVLSTLLLGAFSTPAPSHKDNSISNWEQFQALLDTVDSAALHSVLHSLSPKFQDGVFSKDRSAIEHVHSEDPAIASKLVHLAKKRQASNSTTTSGSSSSSSASSVSSSISSVLSSAIHASTVPAATTVTVAPSAPAGVTPIRTTKGAVVYSTYGGGLVTLTSSAIGVVFTPSTSTNLFFTTLPNGNIQTSTSLVVVNAPVTDNSQPTGAAGASSSGKPGLQGQATSVAMSGCIIAFAGLAGVLVALQII